VHQRRRRQRSRNRTRVEGGAWEVRARVERFGEPALLALLATRPTHGYELIERLPELSGEDRVDVGNLYRALRSLEEEGLVTSEWSADLPGPTKRTYTLTREGHELLAAWLASIERLRDGLTTFLETTQEGGDHVRIPPPTEVGAAGSEP
jgi:PadR family transcriptional regulator, regulatory protein PadR